MRADASRVVAPVPDHKIVRDFPNVHLVGKPVSVPGFVLAVLDGTVALGELAARPRPAIVLPAPLDLRPKPFTHTVVRIGIGCRVCLGVSRELWRRAELRLRYEVEKSTCGPFKFRPNDPPLDKRKRDFCKYRAQKKIEQLRVPDGVYGDYVRCAMMGARWPTVYKTCR